MQNLSREDSLLTLSGTAALTKWVCCRGKLLWTVWVQNTCEICEPEPVGTLRIATTLCIQGMVAEMDDWAFKNQARLRYDRFWIKASWQILAEKLSNKNMKQLHRYAAHAETLQEVPDTATSTCNMRCPTMHLLLSSSLMSRSRKDGCARASRPGQLMMVMLFWSILWIAVKQCKA